VQAFILRNFLAQGFGSSLDLLGIYGHPRQFLQQLATFLETDQSSDRSHHPRQGRRQGAIFDSQLPIARTEAVTARRAVVISSLQPQPTENTLDLLDSTSGEASLLPTPTADRALFIGPIGIQTLCHGLTRQSQNLLSNGHFQSLQIQFFHGLAAQQDLNFLHEVDGQQIGEEVFF
jgi:hypothetical protein